MPRSTLTLPMLAAALWMVQNPDWWIKLSQNLQDTFRECADRLVHELRGQSPWERPVVLPERARRPRNDRRMRMALRLMGGLLAILAATQLYEEAVWMLTH
ncbi:MAG: hypothetical protein ACLQU1_26190 [Bryobacteraceae bacterium]